MATLNTGEFEKIVITDAGRAMISGARDDNNITFTRIALGDGQIESPDDIFTLTEIKNECLSVPIVSKTDVADGQMRLEFRLNNSEIETSFTFREIGIMAHMADGIEQLYAYTYAKDPTQIYDKNTPIQERIIFADIVVGNSENINIILDLSNTYARIQDIVDHNTDPTAHKTGIAGNAATSTKALQDTKGQQIDTTYIKSITASNATITTTKGNGATSNITINNVAHATNADNATKATNDSDGKAINATYIKKASGAGENLTLANDNFGGQLTIKRNSGNAATIKYTNTNNVNRYIGFTRSDKTMYRWGDNGDGQTAFLDASNYNNYAPTKTGGGASGTWNISISGNAKTSSSTPILSSKGDISASSLPNTFSTGLTTHSAYNGGYPIQYGNVINVNNKGKSQLLLEWKGDDTAAGDPGHLYYRECRDNQNAWSNWKTIAFTSDNVASATKATQDSAGQTINTTYVKAVTASNATITVTKGNGSTSTATINNVSNASNLVISGTSAYIKYGGGDVDESTAISQNKVNLVIGSWWTTGFRDLQGEGTPIRVAINHRSGNIRTTGNITANGAMYTTTPSTSENSTRVATTAFVHSLLGQRGNTTASKGTNSWWKDANTGMIYQFGYVNGVGHLGTVNVTFPISFPTKVVFAVSCSNSTSTGNNENSGSCGGVSLSKMTVVLEGGGGWWLAMGY
nr:MAG: tail-collar fiber protein [Bacteriophage sp.]